MSRTFPSSLVSTLPTSLVNGFPFPKKLKMITSPFLIFYSVGFEREPKHIFYLDEYLLVYFEIASSLRSS